MANIAEVVEKKFAESEILIHLIVFKLGNEDYGIRIEQIKEVTITPEVTKMPRTPFFIKGVANIRGDIVAIMDLEERFNIAHVNDTAKKNPQTYTLVVEAEDYKIGLVVSEVPQSLALPITQIDKTPNIIQENNVSNKYIDGIGKYEGRLIIVLDIYKILNVQETTQLMTLQEG